MRLLLTLLLSLALAASAAAQDAAPRPNPDAPATAYVGGRWWDGERFEPRDTTWAEAGVFVPGQGAAPARTVGLGDAYVVPPYGDAHQHMLDGPYSAQFADSLFLDPGVFYVLVVNNPARSTERVRERFEGPGSIDVAYTHGGWTSTGSHPGPLYEGVARNAAFDGAAPRTDSTAWSLLGDAYWFVDGAEDVGPQWARFLRDAPDAVKVYLGDVAAGVDKDDMRGHGLRPEVLAEIVRRADAAGLPVYAHVDTADDVRLALDAGVDGLAHLPHRRAGRTPDGPIWLDAATISRLAHARVPVVPTASLLMQGPPGRWMVLDPTRRDTLQAEVARQAEELRALVAAGVPVALGADRWMQTSKREADYLVAQEVFDAATTLDLWTRVTPQTVFPGRAVGRLAPGYEASLLALACDPTADWACAERIEHREKQGAALGEETAEVRRVRQPRRNPDAPATAYVGGRWFDGERFVDRDTTWAVDGVFAAERPESVEQVIDLGGASVVPPFGDAHTHTLSSAWSVGIADRYVEEGTFYALVLTDEAERANAVRDQFDGPSSIDVAYAHGGFTSTGSHPALVYEMIALGYYDGRPITAAMTDEARRSRLNEGDAYWNVDAVADLDAVWPRFLAGRPDAVKVYLMDVAAGMDKDDMTGHGLRPDVLRAVVARARAAGLPVWAHVETAADVALAVEGGVDGLAHLPGYGYDANEPETAYTLSDEAVAQMAERGVVVVPTVALTPGYTVGRPARLALARDLQRRQLRRLHRAGVPVALGADWFGRTAKLEPDYLHAHGFFDNATILRLWSETTPQAVFPGRAVGRLAPGFEASLLALACDPTADWSCTGRIRQRVKQGVDLGAETAGPTASGTRRP